MSINNLSIQAITSLKEGLKALQQEAYRNAVEKGFWENEDIIRKLCYIHSEVSEAVEDFRADKLERLYTCEGKPVGFPVELADIILRVLGVAEHLQIDIVSYLVEKHVYNLTRPYKHNKAF